jgi:predicted nucleic acid-binding protein
MLYFDTSFLVPLVFQESTSQKVERFIGSVKEEELATSHWTSLEFSSVLTREVRSGRLQRQAALDAEARFDILMAESFTRITPTAADFQLSRQYLGSTEARLRIGDAFHLAIAKNHGASTILSLDKGLVRAADIFGLSASVGIR